MHPFTAETACGQMELTMERETPLDQPLYGASLPQAVSRFFRNYTAFTGRASRSEFWWCALVIAFVHILFWGIIGFAITLANSADESLTGVASIVTTAAYAVYLATVLGVLVPGLALLWRRLHDANRPGMYFLLAFIPLGVLVLLAFTLLPSNPAGRRFDKQPFSTATSSDTSPVQPHTDAVARTSREVLRSIAELIAPNDAAVLDRVTLAVDDPEDYVAVQNRLYQQSIDKPHPDLGWDALRDALLAQGFLGWWDWKDGADVAVAWLRELKSAPTTPGIWDWTDDFVASPAGVAGQVVDLEQLLARAGRELSSAGVAVAWLDSDSDTFLVVLIPSEQSTTLVELARELGHRVNVY